ncbi:MAG: hypothetical protein QXZ28_00210 [Candidatus Methanomethylicaceae archaeon]|nr:hypothetical protein [Candidatus Verstraetearchaeota archaeon]
MGDDFNTRIKNLYESKRAEIKKEINNTLLSLSKRIDQKKDELYKEVL